ncbi:LacI family DNA-binding transcriptional regulator [Kineococcus rhizosphaerae]|uniref:LacI family transcriptional regulator n=1 Tax=Kineococcus rhizosphaerae TaxID=559628 RepID=A0A2T0R3V5_9ACTN|nr:LacI family DNA-binding transcriptional regulator [Kineococcus rhizosphaerae]PRY14673.1 LacI family transcriptional regulator [Kineococcus rhizosphaerae]
MSVTRADVARYAGVSSAVVSYVVNDGPRPVAAATAARVREAIEVLGYRPNPSAQALRRGSSRLLGHVVPDLGNPLWAQFALAVEEVAAGRGYDVLLASTEGGAEAEHRRIETLVARGVDALIVTSVMARPDLVTRAGLGVPLVLLNTFFEVPGFPSLGFDALGGARTGTAHLLGHGRGPVGLVIGGETGELREQGWRAAAREAGTPEGPIARGEFSRHGGYGAGLRLFGSPDRPRSVFVSSDLQAVGVLRALFELGLRVPEDVAVVSFDGTVETEFTNPQLTTVRQPVEAMARAAVARALDGDTSTDRQVLPAELVVRGSCGCGSAG